MTALSEDSFLSCNLQAAAVAPRAELCKAVQEANLRELPMAQASEKPSEMKQSPRSEMWLLLAGSLGSDWQGNTVLPLAALFLQ